MKNFREELIQVAAVAVAMVEDLDYGSADSSRIVDDGIVGGSAMRDILLEVGLERKRQDQKWGPQHHDPFTWLMILMEEVGEVAEEVKAIRGDSPFLVNTVIRAGERSKHWLETTAWEKDFKIGGSI